MLDSSPLPTEILRRVCAWCGKVMHEGGADAVVTHGICATCAAESGVYPVEDVHLLDAAQLDELPWGTIELDPAGQVLSYNVAEERIAGLSRVQTLGRNFFTEVAPCTGVREFRGSYDELVRSDSPGPVRFDFVFRFPGGDRLVDIALSYDAGRRRGTLLVRSMD